eukprot:25019-Pyramimonas_sp.AAC.2
MSEGEEKEEEAEEEDEGGGRMRGRRRRRGGEGGVETFRLKQSKGSIASNRDVSGPVVALETFRLGPSKIDLAQTNVASVKQHLQCHGERRSTSTMSWFVATDTATVTS